MPQKPKRPCRYPGCPGFCEQGQVFCKDHRMYSDDRMRGGASARGYDARWREAWATMFQQANVFLEFFDFRRDVFALVMKNKCNKIIIPYITCFTKVSALINQDTKFAHEKTPKK